MLISENSLSLSRYPAISKHKLSSVPSFCNLFFTPNGLRIASIVVDNLRKRTNFNCIQLPLVSGNCSFAPTQILPPSSAKICVFRNGALIYHAMMGTIRLEKLVPQPCPQDNTLAQSLFKTWHPNELLRNSFAFLDCVLTLVDR